MTELRGRIQPNFVNMVLLSKPLFQTLLILMGLVIIAAVVLLITINGLALLMELSESTIRSNPVQ